jgi:ElaB/YqjD/DUF883 family membrane-anchored ribosome-binding protein
MLEDSKTSTGISSSSSTQSELQKKRTEVREVTDDLASEAKAVAEECREKAAQLWNDGPKRTRTFQEEGEQYVRDNPMKTVITVLGVGIALGLIYRR